MLVIGDRRHAVVARAPVGVVLLEQEEACGRPHPDESRHEPRGCEHLLRRTKNVVENGEGRDESLERENANDANDAEDGGHVRVGR
eukprot:6213220-Pleurochrysis_carterae.AAC.9